MPTGDSEGRTPGGDSRPTPDPTTLTTEQLERAIKALREVLEEKIARSVDAIAASTRECDKAFDGIDKRFTGNEQQRVELKNDTSKQVETALSAAKEAVREQAAAFATATNKSEDAMKEQLKALAATTKTEIAAVAASQIELKERVGRAEYGKVGSKESLSEGRATAAAFLVLITIASVIYALVQSGGTR